MIQLVTTALLEIVSGILGTRDVAYTYKIWMRLISGRGSRVESPIKLLNAAKTGAAARLPSLTRAGP